MFMYLTYTAMLYAISLLTTNLEKSYSDILRLHRSRQDNETFMKAASVVCIGLQCKPRIRARRDWVKPDVVTQSYGETFTGTGRVNKST